MSPKIAVRVARMLDLDPPGLDRCDAAGDHQPTVVGALRAHVLEVHGLVGEDVGRVVTEVVEVEEVVVEEAGRAGHRDHEVRVHLARIAQRPGHLRLALLAAERALHLRREAVDHRVPDRPGELDEVRVEATERVRPVEVDRPRVVLVEDPRLAVVDRERRVAERAVGREDRADGHHAQAVELERHVRLRLHEASEAERLELPVHEVERMVRKDHRRVLGHVVAQEVAVEVVPVDVRDVEVVRVPERRRVELLVGRERHPRGEVGGVEPRVAENRAVARLDVEAGVTEERDLHGRLR